MRTMTRREEAWQEANAGKTDINRPEEITKAIELSKDNKLPSRYLFRFVTERAVALESEVERLKGKLERVGHGLALLEILANDEEGSHVYPL